jgi:hypothetical protein
MLARITMLRNLIPLPAISAVLALLACSVTEAERAKIHEKDSSSL